MKYDSQQLALVAEVLARKFPQVGGRLDDDRGTGVEGAETDWVDGNSVVEGVELATTESIMYKRVAHLEN
uniref:Acyl carrier protein n=1 Tax=Heterorhabditis bacteriophora TaxID=37862 RepID=A0A1I7WM24_HETBA